MRNILILCIIAFPVIALGTALGVTTFITCCLQASLYAARCLWDFAAHVIT